MEILLTKFNTNPSPDTTEQHVRRFPLATDSGMEGVALGTVPPPDLTLLAEGPLRSFQICSVRM